MESIESQNTEPFITERLKDEDVAKYVLFFVENINILEYYSDEEKAAFIKKRNIEFIKEKSKSENYIILITKNSKGEILATIEAEIKVDKYGKKYSIVRWIIVGKNAKKELRTKRMFLGKELGDILESSLKQMGCNYLLAEIKNSNNVSINFCKRFGFIRSKNKHKIQNMSWYYKYFK